MSDFGASRRTTQPLLGAGVGVLLATACAVTYTWRGYHPILLILMVLAVAVVAWSLRDTATPVRIGIGRADVLALAILLAVMAPLYLWRLYTVPWQVNTDEVTIMNAARDMLRAPNADPLGLSWYFGFPTAIFVVFGWLGQQLGGIDLFHMRLLHALFGLGCVGLGYGLFRQFTTPLRAVVPAVLLGANHALVGISRMAMRDNTGLFFELLALLLLVRGLQRSSRTLTVLGGAATGLTYYTYFPSRITLVLWCLVLGLLWLRQPRRPALRRLMGSGLLCLLGWAMVAAPVVIASVQHKDLAFGYQRQQFLFYPEGQALEQSWTSTATPTAAWKANIRQGLATFNGGLHDQGYIYPNYGHGFVDPITGALIWVGLIVALTRNKRSPDACLPDLLAATGFLVLYLAFAFVITKAPNYTRLLVSLPFVAWLAGSGLWWLAERIGALVSGGQRNTQRDRVVATLALLTVGVIVAANVRIFRDFVSTGVEKGNDVGGTARMVEAQRGDPGHAWILAASDTQRYYGWGNNYQWQTWMGFFAAPDQPVTVLPPADLDTLTVGGRFTLFIPRSAWLEREAGFRARYAVDSVLNVVPDGRLVAVKGSAPR
ncbi:MAG: glycosyltransferase family 39 protein [Gemmatimonadota bacterium]